MGAKSVDEIAVLELLEEMAWIAKCAKRIEEVTEAMDNIASQTTLNVLNSIVLKQNISGLKNSVLEASDEILAQYKLLVEDMSLLKQYLEREKNLPKESYV